jgi:putative transposase
MGDFEERLTSALRCCSKDVVAWCVLPNHYHALVESENIQSVLHSIGLLHGRLSWEWNGEDNQRGRKVWFNCLDRPIRGERHFWATVNYIHNNPVHHGYAKRWQDWPLSSAAGFLERVGRAEAEGIWRKYPIPIYGKGWDDRKL